MRWTQAHSEIQTAATVAAALMLRDIYIRTAPEMRAAFADITEKELRDAVFRAIEELDGVLYLEEGDIEAAALVAAKNAVVSVIRDALERTRKNEGVTGFIAENYGDGFVNTVEEELWGVVNSVKSFI